MKKCIAAVLSIVCLICIFTAAGCGEAGKQKQQEELRQEFIYRMDSMSLLCNPDYPGPKNQGVFTMEIISDDIIFFPNRYELYCHAYALFDGSNETATIDEVRGLFREYNEEAYNKFLAVSNWYLYRNGNMYVTQYNDATLVARDLYNEKCGTDIMPGNRTAWSLEDRIALEDFIRSNPDLMPIEQYDKELNRMGIYED